MFDNVQSDGLLAKLLVAAHGLRISGGGPPKEFEAVRFHSAPRRAAAPLRRLRIPRAPAYAGEASLVGRKRPPGLPFIGADDVLRLPDLLFELGHRLLRLADAVRVGVACRE